MKISIQISANNSYGIPTIHDVDNDNEAQSIAYAISKQLGRITVRMTKLTVLGYEENTGNLKSYVERLNGEYFQSK